MVSSRPCIIGEEFGIITLTKTLPSYNIDYYLAIVIGYPQRILRISDAKLLDLDGDALGCGVAESSGGKPGLLEALMSSTAS